MKTEKAVVLEKKGSLYYVLMKNGEFKALTLKTHFEIGEEIWISRVNIWDNMRKWGSVAALFLLLLGVTSYFSLLKPSLAVALISIDINPSIELTVNQNGEVLDTKTYNDDAKLVLSQLNLKHKSSEKAIEDIVSKATELNFLTPENDVVVIGVSPLQSNQDLPVTPAKLQKSVKKATPVQAKVMVYELSEQENKLAQDQGVTIGEYGLYQDAQENGISVKPEALIQKTERKQTANQILEKQTLGKPSTPQDPTSSSSSLNESSKINPATRSAPQKQTYTMTPSSGIKPQESETLEKTETPSTDTPSPSTIPDPVQNHHPLIEPKSLLPEKKTYELKKMEEHFLFNPGGLP